MRFVYEVMDGKLLRHEVITYNADTGVFVARGLYGRFTASFDTSWYRSTADAAIADAFAAEEEEVKALRLDALSALAKYKGKKRLLCSGLEDFAARLTRETVALSPWVSPDWADCETIDENSTAV
jgi:hypothetical protein